MKSVYIHIPFCSNICSYCDFSKIYYNKKIIIDYLNALENEIKNKYNGEIIKTLYIGGGTPSCLSVDELEKLFNIITIFNLDNNCEFTIECNPENLDEEKIKLFKNYNVNRVSLGVQSFNPEILKILNRKHNKKDVFKTVELLKKYNINNINIDLIFGINNQTINDIKEDLDTFINLNIPHISYYSLILEDNTLLALKNYTPIDDDLCASMYEYICGYLNKRNYEHYEISNFSISNYESIHNLTYWNNEEYYGFGLGAHGYINNIRYENTRSITTYLDKKYLFYSDKISKDINIENEIILGLRKIKGINKSRFKDKFSQEIYDTFYLDDLLEKKYLIDDGENIFINEKYLFVSNEILVMILNNIRK